MRLEIVPCGSCPYWLGLNQSCPECEEARRGGPEFQQKLARLIEEKKARIRRLKALGRQPVIGLVGCGKSKKEGIHPARELYTGSIFRGSLRVAEADCDEVFILSAKHGLVRLDDRIEAYDYSLFDLRLSEVRRWANGVLSHLCTFLPETMQIEFRFFAGDGYSRPIISTAREMKLANWSFTDPMAGMNVFARLSWCKKVLSEQGGRS